MATNYLEADSGDLGYVTVQPIEKSQECRLFGPYQGGLPT